MASYHKLFDRNMVTLITMNAGLQSRELKSCFKEGMFLQLNHEGFFQVSYFLMNVLYPGTNAFKNCWPIFEKSQGGAFRTVVIELIRGLNKDFGDIFTITDLVPGRLMSPGGNRFVKIFWQITLLALGVQTKRESGNDELFLPQWPPATCPESLKRKAMSLWKINNDSMLKECGTMLDVLRLYVDLYNDEKKKILERMLNRERKMREVSENIKKLSTQSALKDAKADHSMNDSVIQHWNDISSLFRDTKKILEAAVNQENGSGLPVMDATSICSGDEYSKSLGNIYTANGSSSEVSLFRRISDLDDKIKSLNPVFEKSLMCSCSNMWHSIFKEKMVIEFLLTQSESKLKEESSLVACLLAEGEMEYMSQASSISLSTAASTSTPIKNIHPNISGTEWLSSTNLTPYQPPTSQDFFSVKLEEAQKVVTDVEESSQPQRVNFNSNDSMDEILERFRKIVVSRGPQSFDRVFK